ncbi:MAG: bifunctional folylpolyglutamate synthase/dihydrofolate synthase [Gemmatimonadetes bacterium]|nr:bifunctional folylpolyglutamate synthase/dihydrofolate synthase [Gemmatimonadota bacterium]
MAHPLKTYHDALDFLYARTTGKWKLGLERVQALLRALGDPQESLRALHVAGTNGKGSVCATLDAVMHARGLRVARYTSPHLVDFPERFLIGGTPVTSARIVDWVTRWTPEVERLGATFFEATTAMAFQFFREDGVDIAVIETGLGGRLDATNVLRPLVAGVTNIQIDHVEYLGATREEIAFEKAGIFKPGIPAIVGEPELGIRGLLVAHAAAHGATPIHAVFGESTIEDIAVSAEGTRFTLRRDDVVRRIRTPLVGRHQAHNAAVALAMLDALPDDLRPDAAVVEHGLTDVRLPGRFQRVGKHVFDVAHNPDGSRVLARTLAETKMPRPVAAVFSVLSDKDWAAMMAALAPHVDLFILTNSPTAPASRAWNVTDVMAHARANGWSAEVVRDFDRALTRAAAEGETVLITGSFHTVGDAMTRLGVSPTA